jgi:hypothetical protein
MLAITNFHNCLVQEVENSEEVVAMSAKSTVRRAKYEE